MSKEQAALSLGRLAATKETLELLTRSGDAQEVGRRALLLSFLISPAAFGTQRKLAKRMGVSPARASQMLNVLRRQYGQNSQ